MRLYMDITKVRISEGRHLQILAAVLFDHQAAETGQDQKGCCEGDSKRPRNSRKEDDCVRNPEEVILTADLLRRS